MPVSEIARAILKSIAKATGFPVVPLARKTSFSNTV